MARQRRTGAPNAIGSNAELLRDWGEYTELSANIRRPGATASFDVLDGPALAVISNPFFVRNARRFSHMTTKICDDLGVAGGLRELRRYLSPPEGSAGEYEYTIPEAYR